jgi:hypothetical protein
VERHAPVRHARHVEQGVDETCQAPHVALDLGAGLQQLLLIELLDRGLQRLHA